VSQAIIQCASESAATAAASAASAGEVWGVTYTGTAGSDGDWLCLEGDDAEVNAVRAAIPSTAFDWADGRIFNWASQEGRFAKALLG